MGAYLFHNRFKHSLLTAILGGFLLCPTDVMAQAGGVDPCPVPRDAMQNTPGSMATIQEDIDRFTLCVERAQLLDRLNTLVEKNIDTIDSVILQPQALPPLPVSSDPVNSSPPPSSERTQAPQTPAPIDEASLQDPNFDNTGPTGFSENGANPDMLEEEQEPVWLIREIFGRSGALKARLVSSDGELATIEQGDVLSDDSRIVQITSTSVSVKIEQDIEELQWVNDEAENDM